MPGTTERPVYQRFLFRPRIHSLLRETSKYPRTTVIAGSRTGKTLAVSDYVNTSGGTVLWVDLNRLDNLGDHLWATLLRAMEPVLPELAAALAVFPYAPTPRQADDFLSIWRQHTATIPSIALVFDYFQLMDSPEPFRFLHCLLEAELRNLRVFVLSSRGAHWNLNGLARPDSLYCLTGDLLAFSPDEVAALLRMHNVPHTGQTVARIMACTEGWAFAVEQVAVRLPAYPPQAHDGASSEAPDGMTFLQREWFRYAPEKTQQLLVRLGLLPAFSGEILRLTEGSTNLPASLRALRTHLFTQAADGQELYHLQPFYQQYLATMAQSLDAGEIQRVCGIAGDWFLAHQYTYEALVCFQKGGQSEKLITALQESARPVPDPRIPAFLQSHGAELSSRWAAESPLEQVRLAHLRMRFLDYDGALEILRPLLDVQEDAPSAETSDRVQGETHLCLAEIALYHASPQAIEHIREAHALLEDGSLFPIDPPIVLGESLIMQAACTSDAIQTILAQHAQILPYANALFRRSFRSFAALYEAEIAFAVFDTRRAFDRAFDAARMAAEDGQHMLVCNAYVLLARIATISGDTCDIKEAIASVDAYAQQHGLREMQPVCTYLRGWMCLRLDVLDAVPESLRDPFAFLRMPKKMLTCNEMLLHCEYWMRLGEYERAQHMIEAGRRSAAKKHLWLPHITFDVLAAICHYCRGEAEKALHSLLAAYEKAQPANIVAPFIEQGEVMRTLINAARRAKRGPGMDEAWLSLVYAKANTYAKRIKTIRQQISQQQQQRCKAPIVKLSHREREILTMICAGLTRQQMGAELGITVHGVKRHITSLYNKLGALNRAHAIRLATTMGLLQGEDM